MFNLREFIKKGLIDAVGKMSDYQIILNAAGWHEKNVLLVEDLAEINALIEEKNTENTPSSVENAESSAEIIEETAEETTPEETPIEE